MSKISNDPDKYYRAGIAMPIAQKPELEKRLAELGMKTIGDLASFFVNGDGVVEAMKPLVEPWRIKRAKSPIGRPAGSRRKLIERLKGMTPEQIEALMKLTAEQVPTGGENTGA